MSDLTSRPYHPDPAKCCEACIFGAGYHTAFCAEYPKLLYRPGGDSPAHVPNAAMEADVREAGFTEPQPHHRRTK